MCLGSQSMTAVRGPDGARIRSCRASSDSDASDGEGGGPGLGGRAAAARARLAALSCVQARPR